MATTQKLTDTQVSKYFSKEEQEVWFALFSYERIDSDVIIAAIAISNEFAKAHNVELTFVGVEEVSDELIWEVVV